MNGSTVAADIQQVTPQWLGAVLGTSIDRIEVERVGTGQIGTCYRLHVASDDDDVPPRLLAKLPSEDPAARELLVGAYLGEVRFYRDIAPTVAIRVPRCHHAEAEPNGAFILLMDDLSPAEQGDQLGGCTVDQARDAVTNLAGLHGPRWCDPTLMELEGLALNGPDDAALLAELYGPATEIFIEALGELVSEADRETLRACVEVCSDWIVSRSERFGLVHGDYRLDNLLFPPDGAAGVTAVDWQTLSLALPARDLSYFVGTSLPVDERREHEQDLVAAYHSALVGHGVADYSFAQCWDDYRFAMIQGPLVSVFGCAYGNRTERGDLMFAAMVERSCAAIRDLDTLTTI